MKLKGKILYQVATNRNFKVGDKLHFGEEFNGQMKIFDFEFNENGESYRWLAFQHAEKGIFKNKELLYKLSNALSNYDLFMREIAVEQVRKEKFPSKPSRFKCMYLSDTKEVVLKNFETMLKKTKGENILYQAIAVKLNGEAFYARDVGLSRPGKSFNEYKQLAESYWGQNQKSTAPVKEILFVGDAEVVEVFAEKIS